MPKPLTVAQQEAFKNLIDGTKPGLNNFYQAMINDGYAYATLANSVVNSDFPTGTTALSYMQESAASQGIQLTEDSTLKFETKVKPQFIYCDK